MEHGLKDISFYVQIRLMTRAVCHNFLLVHDKPHRGARICETSLLQSPFAVPEWWSVLLSFRFVVYTIN